MSLKCTVFETFAFKNFRDLETGVWAHSRSSKMVPVDRAYATSYLRSVVTMGLYRAVCAIFPTPPLFNAPWGRTPLRFSSDLRRGRTGLVGIPDGEKNLRYAQPF